MSVIFCNVGWMERYNGIVDDSIERGGSYNKKSIGHEVCNFSNVDGKVYGYVRPTGQIKIERIGAEKNDKYISGVTVIWTAGPNSGGTAVVGWYRNATVFRDAQKISRPAALQKSNGLYTYRIVASAADSTLLPSDSRSFMIPRGVKGGIGQSNVWYADSPDSKAIVARVLRLVESNGVDDPLPDVDKDAFGFEGNPRLVAHMRRERNASLVQKKKKEVLGITGALKCEACGFDFAKTYGEHGKEFCEVHHLVPLHMSDGVAKTELNELAIVCSNCHRIIHRTTPMPTIQELEKVIREHQHGLTTASSPTA